MSKAPWIVTALAALGGVALVAAVALAPPPNAEAAEAPVAPAASATAPADDPASGAVIGAPENTTVYDVATLTQIDVWSVTPAMPVDDDPFGALTGELAQPLGAAPIFADQTGEPIGYLPREAAYGGTTVPVIVHDTHWVKVMLAGRQGVPPNGNAAQTVGWLRVADIELRPVAEYVEVHLAAHTIDIISGAGAERVADDFAWGKPSTPTPVGRTFVMWTTVVPEFAYTQGHALTYLGVQSPAMAGFDGGEAAVTAFHYYKVRSGDVSFGCIYLDAAATDRLAQLPPGTPVIIHP
ncbi:L,D-transpeptidase [Microbacterium memoriense]|uniref:L,D-transpeptidase n=1 Tax=Microbacterium memoriense TaxID=2978350 RepID=A0ABT2P919_9MICO|nr:L,D-transpeptidase [Microbacterium memoriense]MCT9001082.1 L,D-transpeptidase [Microbacterium memoriense]